MKDFNFFVVNCFRDYAHRFQKTFIYSFREEKLSISLIAASISKLYLLQTLVVKTLLFPSKTFMRAYIHDFFFPHY